ncbi:unnamed protein product, partial [marine sediment metagenome]
MPAQGVHTPPGILKGVESEHHNGYKGPLIPDPRFRRLGQDTAVEVVPATRILAKDSFP